MWTDFAILSKFFWKHGNYFSRGQESSDWMNVNIEKEIREQYQRGRERECVCLLFERIRKRNTVQMS